MSNKQKIICLGEIEIYKFQNHINKNYILC